MEKTTTHLVDEGEIEFGDITPSENADTNREKLVIASYNIRYGVGRFLISTGLLRKTGLNPPQPRVRHVARNLRNAARAFLSGQLLPAPDILALQEADRRTSRAGGHHIAHELATELNMSWLHVSAGIPRGEQPKKRQWWLAFEEKIGLYDPGDTGIALLSRFPLEDVTRIDLPWKECAWRPRLSVGATIRVGPHRLRIFNSHIDPHASADGQLDQLEVVLSHADKWPGATAVLGDFNTLSRRKCIETRKLLEAHGYLTPFRTGTATWRGALIRLHADWIFVRNLKIGKWGVARPLNVSDHWPIWAEVDLQE